MGFEIGIGPNVRKSAYFDATVRQGVRRFSVYNHMLIPADFGDPAAEYDRLMNGVAMWDVAAQRQVELRGADAARLAQYLTPRSLAGLRAGRGAYVPLCDHDGWLINDPVLLKLDETRFWLSVADSDIHLWAAAIGREKGWDVKVAEPDVSPMAVQGPRATDVIAALFGERVRSFPYFGFEETHLGNIPLVLARSGWSKQGGFELYLQDGSRATELWGLVAAAGATFGIGPGAPNDIERIESGLISYGADMRWQDRRANPFEMGFGRLIELEDGHDFVGRDALRQIAERPTTRTRIGLVVEGQETLPTHPAPLFRGSEEVGQVHELVWSPRFGQMIGVCLIRADLAKPKTSLNVSIGGTERVAHVHPLPFISR
ncbi:MAG: glycine cleavage T C-terminal barrel domain-containing protein [Pseudomonadota bacterium]